MSFAYTKDPVQTVVDVATIKEKKVQMMFPGPADVRLATQDGKILVFEPGVRWVPMSLVEFGDKKELHPWLKAHKVTLLPTAENPGEEKPPVDPPDTPPSTPPSDEPPASAVAAVNAMTKAELVAFGKKDLNLDLDPAMKKDDLIAAVMEALKKAPASK